MKLVEKRVIHRFVQDIAAYEEGGEYFDKVIPLNTQAYAIYPNTGADKNAVDHVVQCRNRHGHNGRKRKLQQQFGNGIFSQASGLNSFCLSTHK